MLKRGSTTRLNTRKCNNGGVPEENAAETWVFPAYRGDDPTKYSDDFAKYSDDFANYYFDGKFETDRPDEAMICEFRITDRPPG
jgi:hypothetical protein